MTLAVWTAAVIMAVMAVLPPSVRRLPGLRRAHRWAAEVRTDGITVEDDVEAGR